MACTILTRQMPTEYDLVGREPRCRLKVNTCAPTQCFDMLPCILSSSFFPLAVFQRLSFASHHHRRRIVTTHQTLYFMHASTEASIPSRGLSRASDFPALYPLSVSFFRESLALDVASRHRGGIGHCSQVPHSKKIFPQNHL